MLVQRLRLNKFALSVQTRPLSASPQPREHSPPAKLPKDYEVKISRLPSGLTIISQNTNSPISRVQFLSSAGSRYETPDNYGLTHQLRNLVAQGTKNLVGLDVSYHVSEIGADIKAFTTREHFGYSVEFLKDSVYEAVPLLAEVAFNQGVKHWEVEDSLPSLKADLIELKSQPHARVMEMLHRAAYRQQGLGNGLFAPKFMIGKHSSEMIKSFLEKNFVSGKTALVAYGVDHSLLLKFASDSFEVRNEKGSQAEKSKFFGGERRKLTKGSLSHMALAVEGAALSDTKSSMALSVLANALGTGTRLKWSPLGASRLMNSIQKSAQNPFFARTINCSYGDSGLFGVYLVAYSKDASNVAKAAVNELRSVLKSSLTNEELSSAKTRAKAQVLIRGEEGANILEDMGVQALTSGHYATPSEIAKQIDSVSASDVAQVAKKISGGKFAMAAIGRLENTPYLDELI